MKSTSIQLPIFDEVKVTAKTDIAVYVKPIDPDSCLRLVATKNPVCVEDFNFSKVNKSGDTINSDLKEIDKLASNEEVAIRLFEVNAAIECWLLSEYN